MKPESICVFPKNGRPPVKGYPTVHIPMEVPILQKAVPQKAIRYIRRVLFSRCISPGVGAYDMVGNVWEWVDAKKGDYPRMLGGSFHYGKNADCILSSEGGVGTKSNEVGFRCCK